MHDCDCSPSAFEVWTYWCYLSLNIILLLFFLSLYVFYAASCILNKYIIVTFWFLIIIIIIKFTFGDQLNFQYFRKKWSK